MKKLVTLCAIVLLSVGAGTAAAEGMKHGGGMMFKKVIEKLDLSGDQQSRVRETFKAHKPELKSTREEMKSAFDGLLATALAPDATEDAVRKASQRLAKAQEEMSVAKFHLTQDLDKVFSSEQRDQFRAEIKSLIAARRERMREHFGAGENRGAEDAE